MSIKCVHWALNDTPVEEPVQVLILVAMAERAADDGTATYQSVATVASKARISVRTCQRHLQALEDAGLIVRGDQRHVEHLPGNRRPVVYDLQVHLRRGANLAPQETGVPNSASRGAKLESRGAKQDTLGVPLMADNSSSDSSLLKSSKDSSARATPAPANFVVTDEMQKWARTHVGLIAQGVGLATLERETMRFLDWHRAKGSTFKDWPAAWRNWMLKAQEYAQRDAQPAAARQAASSSNGKLGLVYDGW